MKCLKALGLNNQRLVVNGVFHASDKTDEVANAFEALGTQALDEMAANLRELPQDQVPLRAFDTVGLPALRALLNAKTHASTSASPFTAPKMKQGIGLQRRDCLLKKFLVFGHRHLKPADMQSGFQLQK